MGSEAEVVRLDDVIGLLEAAYPPEAAEPWDAVGLVCGDRAADVRRVMFAVDPVPAVVAEAVAWGADLLVTHHPLLLKPVHSIASDTWKGDILQQLVRSGCALFTAHTNADVARDGVSEVLATALGLSDLRPLRSWPSQASSKVVTFVPPGHGEAVTEALAGIGAGAIGDYIRCAWSVGGTGTFTPQPGANPVIGAVGERTTTEEHRLEMTVPRRLVPAAVAALRAGHPYEEAAIDVYDLAALDCATGPGRIGALQEPTSLVDFVG